MTQNRKLLSLLCAFCILLSCFTGCSRNAAPAETAAAPTEERSAPEQPAVPVAPETPAAPETEPAHEPAAPQEPAEPEPVPGGPFRPGDPGVIAPLSEESELPEDGIVWDMENTPDNLNSVLWSTCMWTSHDDYIENNVEFLGVDGKGYDGSRALAIRQNGDYVWCDVYTLGMKMDETAVLNWKGGAIFWIWYDSSEIDCNMKLEMEVNGAHIATGTTFYTMPEDGTVAKKGGKCPEAWDGAGYGRFPLSGGNRGWIGVPLNGYNVGLGKIVSFNVHLSYDGEQPVGRCLYLDNFCVTPGGVGPMGAELTEVSAALATSDKPAWDMEALPDDPVSAFWINIDGAGWNGHIPGNIRLSGADGKGVNGSRALRLYQAGNYNGTDQFTIDLTCDKTAFTDWSEGQYLWFWMDNRGQRNDVRLDLFVDNQKPPIGTPYYGITPELEIMQAGTLTRAWDSAGYGRMTVGAGYCGWVGIPLKAFGEVTDIMTVTMHAAYDGSADNRGRSVYFDELWVLKEGEIPATATTGGSIYLLQGGHGGVQVSRGSTVALPAEVWSMEKLPDNPVSATWAYAEYPNDKDFRSGNVTIYRADGKGVDGSAALGFRQNGPYTWCDIFNFDLSKDSSAVRNWSNGKMLWFHVDTSEMPVGVRFDLAFDGTKLPFSGTYYLVADGESASTMQPFRPAWEGADYGRINLSTGYSGWVGIPLDQFKPPLTGANIIQFHVAYGGEDIIGKSVYVDSFRLADDMTAPNGASVHEVSETDTPVNYGAAVWNMENIPNNLLLASWASADFEGDGDYKADNVQLLGAAGKGRNGSRALQLQFNGEYCWADQFTLNLKCDSGAATDWSKGGTLWVWVDASNLMADVEMELWLGSDKIDSGAGYYVISGGKAVKGGNLITAWDGKGRIPVSAGYIGFIGVPLSGYGNVTAVRTVTLHIAGNGVAKGRMLYLDDLWITETGKIPKNAADGYFYTEPDPEPIDGPVVAWDMEALDDDPVAAGTVSPKFPDNDQFIPGNVVVSAVNGKGYNGSRALALRQVGEYSWADIFELYLKKDGTASTDWSGAKFFWLWVDASEFSTGITMDFLIDGRYLQEDAGYYYVNGSKAYPAGKAFFSWDGATNARFRIDAGYKGWIGLPFSGFNRAPNSAECIEIHCGYDSSAGYQNRTLYLDHFMLTDDVTGPDGVTIQTEAPEPDTTLNKAVWTMENLPADMSSVASTGYGRGTLGKYVDALRAEGGGFNGSVALGYKYLKYLPGNNGDNILQIELGAAGCETDWSGVGTIWFWVDATAMDTSLLLEVMLDWKRPVIGSKCYYWNGTDAPTEGTLPAAWGDNTTDGRVRLPSRYCGWVGIPASAYPDNSFANVGNLVLYFEPADDASSLPKTVFFDNFWITAEGKTPNETGNGGGGGGYVEPDPPPEDNPEPDTTLNKAVWTMENLPADMSSVASTGYGRGTLGEYVDALRAEGGGFNGSVALGYKYLNYLPGNNGDNILQISLAGAGCNTDWSGVGTIWFWVDATAMDTSLLLEVMLDWNRPVIGSKCYFWNGTDAPTEGTLPAAWGGNTTDGRVRLPSRYCGWVGIPTSAYPNNSFESVGNLVLYFEPSDDASSLPKTVFFDNFWITAEGKTPNETGNGGGGGGYVEPDPPSEEIPVNPEAGTAVWTMEGLPADLARCISTGYGRGTLGEYVDAVACAGKGVNGSTALGYRYLNYIDGGNGNSILQISLAAAGARTDWSGGKLLWFWVDASEMSTALLVEMMLDWKRPAIGSNYYLWSGAGMPVKQTMPAAWGGNTTEGRVKLTSGYVGWVGIPLSAYSDLNTSNIGQMVIYFEPSQDAASLPKTVYFDSFWLTSATGVPNQSSVNSVGVSAPAFVVEHAVPAEAPVTEPVPDELQTPDAPETVPAEPVTENAAEETAPEAVPAEPAAENTAEETAPEAVPAEPAEENAAEEALPETVDEAVPEIPEAPEAGPEDREEKPETLPDIGSETADSEDAPEAEN